MVISTTTLTTVTMAATSVSSFSPDKHRSQHLSRDEYIELRNSQDKHWNAELASIRCSVDDVKQELNEVKRELKADIKELKDDVTVQMQYLEAEIRRSQAFTRNNALKNPTLPIRPVVVYRPGRGILEPDSSRFPRNANDFYSLRDPQTKWHRSMLAYLADFYDVQLRGASHFPKEESNSDDSDDDEIILEHPEL
ncbi:hypothetical protein CABS01_16587, partial [Colletotrichum abscissum]|uniref:uncharacterized protein n=1 Tax=Colletotrichum abscissum TaxID=1671311 RepID=UPI0027D594BD